MEVKNRMISDNKNFLTTERLLLQPLTTDDAAFIFELVNTEGWLKFIGNRNITSTSEAVAYIQKIVANGNINYWVVKLKETQAAIGIVTYIKRDYLAYHDIGFAFLPQFCKQGYAYEATRVVLHQLVSEHHLSHILATTIPENTSSIRLLKKLGLMFEKEIEADNEKLHVYGASADQLRL